MPGREAPIVRWKRSSRWSCGSAELIDYRGSELLLRTRFILSHWDATLLMTLELIFTTNLQL